MPLGDLLGGGASATSDTAVAAGPTIADLETSTTTKTTATSTPTKTGVANVEASVGPPASTIGAGQVAAACTSGGGNGQCTSTAENWAREPAHIGIIGGSRALGSSIPILYTHPCIRLAWMFSLAFNE